ncbi:AraC family transcriptional regulator [Burkholderia pseudomallei]|nr:AraC family transcriptional regulator [Burkholderia pseudomallei]
MIGAVGGRRSAVGGRRSAVGGRRSAVGGRRLSTIDCRRAGVYCPVQSAGRIRAAIRDC